MARRLPRLRPRARPPVDRRQPPVDAVL